MLLIELAVDVDLSCGQRVQFGMTAEGGLET